MQNKPNLLDTQMNVNKVLTKDYENARLGRRFKNKPNQTQFQTHLHPKITPKFPVFSQFWIIPVPNYSTKHIAFSYAQDNIPHK